MRLIVLLATIVVLGGCQRDTDVAFAPKMIVVLDIEPVVDAENETVPFFEWQGRRVALPIAIHLDADAQFKLDMEPVVTVDIGTEPTPIRFPGDPDVRCVQTTTFVAFAEETDAMDVTAITYNRFAARPSQTARRGHVSIAEIQKMLHTIPSLDAEDGKTR